MRIISYNKDVNELKIKGWAPLELNILMVICSRIKESGYSEIEIDISELKEFIKYAKNGEDAIINKALSVITNLQQLQYKIETKDGFSCFVPFIYFKIMKKELKIIVKPTSDFVYLANQISDRCLENFSITEFVSISSKYAKIIYQYLRQFEAQGMWEIGIDDFRIKLNVPDKYKSNRITDKIIRPAMEELGNLNLFKFLSVSPILSKRQGHALEGYSFKFEFVNKVNG